MDKIAVEQYKNITLLITDVDGTLTDGGMYYDATGNELKKFNTRDGKGISLLRERGIPVMFLTSEDTPIVKRRAEKLEIDFCIMGVKDKCKWVDNFFSAHPEFSWECTAYIGDDINDTDALKKVGFSATPADGRPENKEIVDYVCELAGGQGCVREFCEVLLKQIA